MESHEQHLHHQILTKIDNLNKLKSKLTQSKSTVESQLIYSSKELESYWSSQKLDLIDPRHQQSKIFYHHEKKLDIAFLRQIDKTLEEMAQFMKSNSNVQGKNSISNSAGMVYTAKTSSKTHLLKYARQIKTMIVKLELEKRGIDIKRVLSL